MHAFNGRKAAKVAGFLGTVALTGGLIASAVVGTGAYFSDTKADNHLTGTMGSIKVEGHDGSGANNLDAVFTDMLPGETSAQTLRYSNTGHNNEDVWIKFNSGLGDGTGTVGINSLGTFGEVHIAANGSELFASKNLNDKFACGTPGVNGNPDVCPLPQYIKVADNLEPGHTGDFTFSFKPSEKFKNVQLAQLLNLGYDLVATQHGVQPGA